ncbi:hypothetical protein [Novosphingobium pituita]|jgi:hypothetical protein|uniref:DUF937 domain-containing protein n=1 Tax=Novosphingobium pituita TaxID=3056842 RepID=A0ABQ6P651_9SPHN|nr:hypothetical protein [Novosphingobium sp. IK01]MDK4805440.1 hypothetical protein [Novosphingobium aromaticivorans]GMM60738.1 hypothetical protein NUTIK01_15150 [Novosphingobium sp. IK01]
MSMFDSILGQVSSAVDVKNLAAKFGIDPTQAETAIAALAAGHQAKGDTIETAAANSGLEPGLLSQIAEQIGGEGGLTQFASLLGQHPDALGQVTRFLDKDGDGNPLNDLTGFAKGLLG